MTSLVKRPKLKKCKKRKKKAGASQIRIKGGQQEGLKFSEQQEKIPETGSGRIYRCLSRNNEKVCNGGLCQRGQLNTKVQIQLLPMVHINEVYNGWMADWRIRALMTTLAQTRSIRYYYYQALLLSSEMSLGLILYCPLCARWKLC
ncbi:hypothetical protein WUBG_01359 [Wuchereria bancrofti]|uniref:Uncharacterized protein n=1 Tax=Wuchereria bancrofti TaxID=6293 RepID=J9FK56_WUCBA|nr:hypothetical protein WUBG_01359 [Wuchereria bancrofti]